MNDELQALQDSATRLRGIAERLDPDQWAMQAYPTEWTIADVMSHIGSGAVIMARRVAATHAGTDVPEGFNQTVWDEWNGKAPADQVADAITADSALLEAINAANDEQAGSLQFSLGPFSLDFAGFLRLRLSEHAMHTWDVEVALDPAASIPSGAASLIIDNLGMIAGFAAKPDGVERTVKVQTTEPSRDIAVVVGTDRVSVSASEPVDTPDLQLPAEAFIRLIYGRLDPAHTPPGVEGASVETLRPLFPGF